LLKIGYNGFIERNGAKKMTTVKRLEENTAIAVEWVREGIQKQAEMQLACQQWQEEAKRLLGL
jgi:hypothetical protein